MVARFVTLRKYLQCVFCEIKDKKIREYELTPDDWIVLQELKAILMPFFQATEVLEGDKYPTLSLANLFITRILDKLLEMVKATTSDTSRNIIVVLSQVLQRRLENTVTTIRSMTALLDPRTKNEVNPELWDELPHFLKQYVHEAEVSNPDGDEDESDLNGDLFTTRKTVK
jgi:hypothetical protein